VSELGLSQKAIGMWEFVLLDYDPTAMRERLSVVLENAGISMRKASLDAGLSETYVHGVIKLGRDPGVSKLVAVCTALEVSPAYILFGDQKCEPHYVSQTGSS